MARVFISYRRVDPDHQLALKLYDALDAEGHDVFLDEKGIGAGMRWPRTLRARIDRAEWFIAIVSSAYVYRRNCIAELERAVARNELLAYERIVPLWAGPPPSIRDGEVEFEVTGPKLSRSVIVALSQHQGLVWNPFNSPREVVDKVVALLPPSISLIKGMRAFTETDAAAYRDLCGTEQVAVCMSKLQDARTLVIHGVAGAGKTSFVRAGVFAELPPDTTRIVTCAKGSTPQLADGVTTIVLDQFEQALLTFAGAPQLAAATEADMLAWLDREPERRLLFVIRDEDRTPFDELLPRLANAVARYALLALTPSDASSTLIKMLQSARVAYDEAFVRRLTTVLADGPLARVRPALLQLIAHECWQSGHALNETTWGTSADSRLAPFERHVRTSIERSFSTTAARLGALRALRGLVSGDVKSTPRSVDEVAEETTESRTTVEQTLAVASSPTARIASADDATSPPRFQLVHDLFANAIVTVGEREAVAARARGKLLVAGAIAVILGVTTAGAIFLWRHSEAQARVIASQRRVAEAQQKRSEAGRIAAQAVRLAEVDPSSAVALAVEALDALPPSDPSAEAENALRHALANAGGRAVGQPNMITAVALAADGDLLITGDPKGVLRRWRLDSLDARPQLAVLPEREVKDIVASAGGAVAATEEGLWFVSSTTNAAPLRIRDRIGELFLTADENCLIEFDRSQVCVSRVDDPSAMGCAKSPVPSGESDPRVVSSPACRFVAISTYRRTDLFRIDLTQKERPSLVQVFSDGLPEFSSILAVADDGEIVMALEKGREIARVRPLVRDAKDLNAALKTRTAIDFPGLPDMTVLWSSIESENERDLFLGRMDAASCRVRWSKNGPLDCMQPFKASDEAPVVRGGELAVARGGWLATDTEIHPASEWQVTADCLTCTRQQPADTMPFGGGEFPSRASTPSLVAMSHDGMLIAVATGSVTRLWPVERRTPIEDARRLEAIDLSAASTRVGRPSQSDAGDGKTAVSADGHWTARLAGASIQVQNGNSRASFRLEPPRNHYGAPTDVVFRPDSRQLAARYDRAIVAWNLDRQFGVGGPIEIGFIHWRDQATGRLRYDSGGDHLVVETYDSPAGLSQWPSSRIALRAQARRHAGRNLTKAEWDSVFPNVLYRTTFTELDPDHGFVVEELLRAWDDWEDGKTFSAIERATRAADAALRIDDPELKDAACRCGREAGLASFVQRVCDAVPAHRSTIADDCPWAIHTR